MNRKLQNFTLLTSVLLLLLVAAEFFLRSQYVHLQILMSDYDRRHRMHTHYDYFVETAQKAGVSESTFNIYFLGESTMWGVPYGPYLSIPNIVGYQLNESIGGKPVRIVNLSSAAKDVTYTYHILKLLISNKDIFHPSLIVLYSGHNEFLKYHPTDPDFHVPVLKWLSDHSEIACQSLTALCRLKGEILETDVREFLDHDIFPRDPRGHEKVILNYQKHLLSMAELTQKNEIPLVISTLVSNYASWEPNRSIFCSSSAQQKQEFLRAFNQGAAAENQNNFKAALKFYDEALAICSSFAEAHYREGEAYEALGNFERANEAFQKAIDDDGMPVRASSQINDVVRSLSRFEHVHIVDSYRYLRSRSPNGLLDEHLIVDGVHPNLRGYLLISDAIAREIHALFEPRREKVRALSIDQAKKVFHLDGWKMYEVYYQTGRWITRLATWRYDPTKRLNIAESFFNKAIESNPNGYEGFLGLGVISSIRQDRQDAENSFKQARFFDSKQAELYLSAPWVRKILRRSNTRSASMAAPVLL